MHQAPMLEMSLAAEQLALKIWAHFFVSKSRRQEDLTEIKWAWTTERYGKSVKIQWFANTRPGIKLWRVCRGLSIAGGVSATSYPSMDQGPNHVIARDVNGKRLPCFGMRSRGSVWLVKHTYIHSGSEDANTTICSCMFSNSLMISNKTEDWIFIDVQRSKVKGRGALDSGRMMNIHSIRTRFHLHRGGTQTCLSALGMTDNPAVSAYFEAKGCNINRFSVSGLNLTSSVWERWKCCKRQKSWTVLL